MRPGDLAEQPRERQLVGVGRVLLIAQEHDAVPEQGGPQLGDRARLYVAADADPADDRADQAAHLGHLDVLEVAAGGQRHRAVE